MRRASLIDEHRAKPAPEWTIEQWFHQAGRPRLADLRGRVVVLHAFQMLCPGCVTHGLPQAQRIRAVFDSEDVAVVGLHCVFEHHAAMRPVSLAAFLHEYRIDFPVAVDTAVPDGRIPATMHAFAMRGTPTLILIDAQGRLRLHAFGQTDDVAMGAAVATLVAERDRRSKLIVEGASFDATRACDEAGCAVSRPSVDAASDAD